MQFSRFDSSSELSALNRDPRSRVPVTAMMTRFVEAALRAAEMTEGLVDPTLVSEIERAGYARHFSGEPLALSDALRRAPADQPGGPHPEARWRQVSVDRRHGSVTRPAGVRLDSGGVAKGLFGDVLAAVLSRHDTFAIEASGDIRFGGASGAPRPIRVAGPSGGILHTFELARGAVATSGITKRSWIGDDGRPAHHLLDPATGRPAHTGVLQVTALAPTGVQAEALAKAALLSGPDRAASWLHHGGVVVRRDGTVEIIDPSHEDTGR